MNYKWDHFSVLVLINDLFKDDFSHIVYVLNYKNCLITKCSVHCYIIRLYGNKKSILKEAAG